MILIDIALFLKSLLSDVINLILIYNHYYHLACESKAFVCILVTTGALS